MKLMERFTTIKNHVGKRQDEKVLLKSSYRIYDRCEICPLSVYIDAVCNNNLQGLVIEGKPSEDVLLLAKSALTIEFSELSGNSEAAIVTNLLKQMYGYLSQIQGLKICVNLIQGDRFEDVIEYLSSHNIKADKPSNDEEKARLIKQIEGQIKGKSIQFEHIKKRYDKINVNASSGKPRAEYYTELLITLSKHVGYHLKKDKLTLSEFALYLKDFTKHIETLNNKNHGR